MNNKKMINNINIVLGALIFVLGINLFIVPIGLYNGGVVGLSQIIRTVMGSYVDMPAGVDVAGIINFVINIPLLILAYRSISKSFFVKTVINVVCQTILFTVIKIPETPIIEDPLAASLIGGILTAVGIGITLTAGGSGGGIDILGVYVAKKYKGFSVGKLGLIINAFIYAGCAVLFTLPTAIYSIIYAAFYALVVDKIHYQNINTTAMIFTKQKNIQQKIMNETKRGVTYWKGYGAYTDEESYILLTTISKFEIAQIKSIVKEIDPKAFIIFNDGADIDGNFEKRL